MHTYEGCFYISLMYVTYIVDLSLSPALPLQRNQQTLTFPLPQQPGLKNQGKNRDKDGDGTVGQDHHGLYLCVAMPVTCVPITFKRLSKAVSPVFFTFWGFMLMRLPSFPHLFCVLLLYLLYYFSFIFASSASPTILSLPPINLGRFRVGLEQAWRSPGG